ncbi:MAG: oligoribonuclease [Actinomycetes bacterium]
MLDRLVWIDCEMTGLDLRTDALIEVALVVTDSELRLLDPGIDLVVTAPQEVMSTMVDVVQEMHAASGLIEAVAASTLEMGDAEKQLLDYLREFVPEPRKAPLCGNSVATDRAFLARDMPALEGYLHYRMVDVSSVKELTRRWYPKTYYNSPPKNGGHRALADILESIDELRYYRSTVFVPPPGPDAETAAAAASAIVGASVPPVAAPDLDEDAPPLP